MASSSSTSRLCSDEELQKARADLDEFLAGEDEFDCLSGEEDTKEEMQETLGKKNKNNKKKKVVVPMETVQTFLNYKCKVREDKSEDLGEFGVLCRASNAITRHFVDRITALQDKLRHKVEAKGYAEYEATDDEDEEEHEQEEEQEQEEKHEETPPASRTNAP